MRNAWDLANMGSKKIAAMISLNFIEAYSTVERTGNIRSRDLIKPVLKGNSFKVKITCCYKFL